MKLKLKWVIGGIIVLLFICIILFWKCWMSLLSNESSKLYNELYPESRDTTIVVNIPVYMKDTTYIGGQEIITNKSILIPQSHTETISDAKNKPSVDQLALLGDSAGLWSAVFSGLAFIGVVITIIYQVCIDHKLDKSTRIQGFCDEFYRLLDCLSKLVIEIEIKIETNSAAIDNIIQTTPYSNTNIVSNNGLSSSDTGRLSAKGRSCFEFVYRIHPNCIESVGKKPNGATHEELQACFANHFEHYFRMLYRILKYIDSAKLLKGIKKKNEIKNDCYGILKAHLSTYELLVIFYNGLLAKNVKALPLYERARLFDNLECDYLVFQDERKYYSSIKKAKSINDLPQNTSLECKYDYTAFVRFKDKNSIRDFVKVIWHVMKLQIENMSKKEPKLSPEEQIFIKMVKIGEVLSHTKLKSRLPFKKEEFEQLIDELIQDGKIKKIHSVTGKRTITSYKRIC